MSHTHPHSAMDRPRPGLRVTPFDIRCSHAVAQLASGASKAEVINEHGIIVWREAVHRLPLAVLVKM